jgi:2-dehydro-3-deoxyphosphogluconate aldolase/(4S)-4-hydroxy-2-oxoglutarate aldolase
MCRWPPTSDPAADLIASLNHQPVLVVLRPETPLAAATTITHLASLGLRHIEIAWQTGPCWIQECRDLIRRFPDLRLGAASVHSHEGLISARDAGFRYAVSPVFDPQLCSAAGPDLVLVPGVMTPTEVWRARSLGCRLVKLFPAASLGPEYWRRLLAPLGAPLPFCIAAGGLGPADVLPWRAAGVDAVAMGSRLGEKDASILQQLLAELGTV